MRQGIDRSIGQGSTVTVLVATDVRNPAEVQLPPWHVAVLLLAGVATGVSARWLMRRGKA
jgi:hypothetical protein